MAQQLSEQEPRYLMERDDGTLVWVPASKLDEFDPSDTEPTARHRRFAEEMVEYLMSKYAKPRQS